VGAGTGYCVGRHGYKVVESRNVVLKEGPKQTVRLDYPLVLACSGPGRQGEARRHTHLERPLSPISAPGRHNKEISMFEDVAGIEAFHPDVEVEMPEPPFRVVPVWDEQVRRGGEMCRLIDVYPLCIILFRAPANEARAGAILQCSGEIDLSNVLHLEHALVATIEAGAPALHVDLRGVEYLDSCAIKALLKAHRELARTGRSLSLQAGPRTVRLFRLFGLDAIFDIRGPVEDARDMSASTSLL
jgi:anti-anti-sigma factor